MPIIALALLIAAALGGGVSVAANNTLPGDALYGFKTHINEPIESALSFSDQAKANWELSAAQARLEEAKELASAGKLSAAAQAELSANFNIHADAVAQAVAKLQKKGDYKGAADIAARFQSTLAAYSSAFVQADAGASADTRAAIAPLLNTLRATLGVASTLSAEASQQEAAHEKEDAAAESGTSSESSTSVHTGTRVNVGTNGDGDDSAELEGTGSVNTHL